MVSCLSVGRCVVVFVRWSAVGVLVVCRCHALKGCLPNRELLEKHNLVIFDDFCVAIRFGVTIRSQESSHADETGRVSSFVVYRYSFCRYIVTFHESCNFWHSLRLVHWMLVVWVEPDEKCYLVRHCLRVAIVCTGVNCHVPGMEQR